MTEKKVKGWEIPLFIIVISLIIIPPIGIGLAVFQYALKPKDQQKQVIMSKKYPSNEEVIANLQYDSHNEKKLKPTETFDTTAH